MQVVRVAQRALDLVVDIVAPFLVAEHHSQNPDAIVVGNPPIRMNRRPVIVVDAVMAQLHNLGRQSVESDPGVLPVFLFLVDITLQLGQDDGLASHELIHSCQGKRHPVAGDLVGATGSRQTGICPADCWLAVPVRLPVDTGPRLESVLPPESFVSLSCQPPATSSSWGGSVSHPLGPVCRVELLCSMQYQELGTTPDAVLPRHPQSETRT